MDASPRARRCEPHGRRGHRDGARGPIRQRQEHALAVLERAGDLRRWADHNRRPSTGGGAACPSTAGTTASRRGHGLSAVQPIRPFVDSRQRGPSAPRGAGIVGGGVSGPRPRPARPGRAPLLCRRPSGHALGRPAAAGGDCEGAGHAAPRDALRRTDQRPRSGDDG